MIYVFEKSDGTRYAKQYQKFSDAEKHATEEQVTIVERKKK